MRLLRPIPLSQLAKVIGIAEAEGTPTVFSEEHDDDFIQAGTLVREIVDDEERKRLVETLVDEYEP